MSALLNDPFFMLLSAALIGAIGYNIWQVVYRDKAWKQGRQARRGVALRISGERGSQV